MDSYPALITGLTAIQELHDISLVSDDSGNYRVEPATVASADVLAVDSGSVSFRGSWWDATVAAAEESEFSIVNSVSEDGTGTLSFLNTLGLPSMTVSQDGDLSVKGRLYLSDRGVMQNDAYLYYDSSSPLGGYVRTNAAGFSTGSYDFAETFPSSDELEAGELVMIDVSADEHVKRAENSSASNGYLLAGIVSTRPGFLAGVTDEGYYPVALQGRVPTKVNLENGPIGIGDPIAISSTPGEGMRADAQSYVVGIALQNYDGIAADNNVISVFLKVGWYNGESVEVQTESLAGTITTEITGPVDFKSQPLVGIGAMEGVDGKWSIDSEGKLVSSEVRTDNLIAKQATVEVNDEMQTAGRSRIITGNSEVRVYNAVVKPNSMIFVTFYGGIGGDWWISEKLDGSFVVKLSVLAPTDLAFEYWVVDLEDNRTVVEEPVLVEEDFEPATISGPEAEPPAEEPASTATAEDEPPADGSSDVESGDPEELVEDTLPEDAADQAPVSEELPAEEEVLESSAPEEPPATS
jgi:hypothetical protein